MQPLFYRYFLTALFLVSLNIVWLASSAQPAQAQTTTFQITPALKEVKVAPNDQGNFDITIFNKSDQAQPVKVYARNFTAKGVEGELTFADDNTMSYAAAGWIHLSTSNLLIPAGSQDTVNVQYIVPPQAEPGGKYAAIMFEQVIQPTGIGGRDSQVQVASRMVSLIYFTVSGDIIEAGQLLGASTGGSCQEVLCGFSAPSFLDRGPVPFKFIFTNTGNVHVRPKGYISITQFGRQVAKLPLDDRAVLPNSQRQFTADWQRSLIIGPYQAQLNLVFGSNNYTIQAHTSFWAFPWQVAIILGLVVIAVIGFILRRKYGNIKKIKGNL